MPGRSETSTVRPPSDEDTADDTSRGPSRGISRSRVMASLREARSIELRSDELRDLVRRSREVVLLAAVTGAVTGTFVFWFEYVVVEELFHTLEEADWKWGLVIPPLGLVVSAIILSLLGRGATSATSDEYLRAFHDGEYPLRWRAFVARVAAAVTTLGSGGAMTRPHFQSASSNVWNNS
ncbi:MAG: hypothetical protein AAFP84_19055, partial [Actinomycetota bacterium]